MKFKRLLLVVGSLVTKLTFASPSLIIPNLIYADEVEARGIIKDTDMRGAIIKSGMFKVVEAPKKLVFGSSSSLNRDDNQMQDGYSYALLGKVVSLKEDENVYKLANSDKNSVTHNISAVVNYKLVRISDKVNIAAFTVTADVSDTKFTSVSNKNVTFNRSWLLKELSNDLAKNVMEQLSEHTVNETRTQAKLDDYDDK